MTTKDEVAKASKRFYAALNRMLKGNAESLADIWSHSTSVTTMHPVGGREVGWGKVKGVWQQVAKAMSDGRVNLNDQLIRIVGDMAYEVGNERGWLKLGGQRVTIKQRVTNIYRKEASAWKIVHHHTDVSPMMLEALGHLQGKK